MGVGSLNIGLFAALVVLFSSCHAQLSPNFYSNSCPNVESIVRATLTAIMPRDVTASAALLRLFFHDCQVQGCDGSVLLDSQGDIVSELESPLNFGIRRLDFIDTIKAAVELACPNTVSCADIVVMAARDAVNMAAGPFVKGVSFGRRDATMASRATADAELPPADVSFDGFRQVFASKGMSLEESVAMLGAHTLGVGHCVNIVNRLYPQKDPALGPLFYSLLRLRCPATYTNAAVVRNDVTSLTFDTQYYVGASIGRGLFTVDAEVARNPETGSIVQKFAINPQAFFEAFSSGFVKLSLANVLTGSQGQIRRNCRFVN